MAKEPLVRLEDVRRSYAGRIVLDKLSLQIERGEVVALLGNNGSGKSTLLKALSGLSALDGGSRLASLPLKRIGFAPDRFPRLRFTAREYLRAMGKIRGMEPATLERTIERLFELFRLQSTESGRLRDFSKGMLQKVNLMQALLEEPELLLLDEPLSGLDAQTRAELTDILHRLKEQGMAIVFSTHERELVERIADRVVRLENGGIAPLANGGSAAPVSCKIVEFELADAEAEDVCAGSAGVVSKYEHGGGWGCRVEADRCDDFLRAVLKAGGSIRSVRVAPGTATVSRVDDGG
ncbi:ATP-binding cassette domain-containing protein [Cohnella sp.]|uniref:ATP-binding cassette domain-containing protein n=1 Tax=Cohnella sp. TaxID=1883426 RepID=UPI003566AEE4